MIKGLNRSVVIYWRMNQWYLHALVRHFDEACVVLLLLTRDVFSSLQEDFMNACWDDEDVLSCLEITSWC